MQAGGVAAFGDLGSGTTFGSAVSLRVNDGLPLDVVLNASALSALNSASALFAFGGSLSTLNHPGLSEFIFGTSAALPPNVQLLLTTDDVGSPAVPEPSSVALLGMGLSGLCGYRWRNAGLYPTAPLARERDFQSTACVDRGRVNARPLSSPAHNGAAR